MKIDSHWEQEAASFAMWPRYAGSSRRRGSPIMLSVSDAGNSYMRKFSTNLCACFWASYGTLKICAMSASHLIKCRRWWRWPKNGHIDYSLREECQDVLVNWDERHKLTCAWSSALKYLLTNMFAQKNLHITPSIVINIIPTETTMTHGWERK